MKIIEQKKAVHYLSQGLKQNRLSPSLLFVGPSGVGKRTVAVELAKALSCARGFPPCDDCLSCLKIQENKHPDVLVLNQAVQATLIKSRAETQKSMKIESVRHLTKFLSFKPLEAKRRVVILEDAETLSLEAANALLKILEEPPHGAQLVLLVTHERNLPSTIASRCAVVRFTPISTAALSTWLEENEDLPQEDALRLAESANGSFAQALKNLDEKGIELNLSDYKMDEFFQLLSEPSFRREGKKKANQVISHLLAQSQKKFEEGDSSQDKTLRLLLSARQQIDRYVPPRLVLENLYLKLQSPQ